MISNWSPLAVSLWVASWSGFFALILGSVTAWLLEKTSIRFKWLLESITMLALVLPPTVLGYYLLTLFGRQGLGPFLEQAFGLRIVFALPGAVLAATVAAIPLVVQAVRAGFSVVSKEIENAARVDGCTEWQVFLLIDLKIAWRGILAGGVLGFLRALGDFGATLMIAGNIPGRTRTLAMVIYDAVQTNDLAQATQLVLLLSSVVIALLFIAMRLSAKLSKDAV